MYNKENAINTTPARYITNLFLLSAMKLSNEMHNKFKDRFKSTCCRVLIKDYEFGSKEHIKRCTNVTGEVCEMVTQLILENKTILSKIL